MKYLKKFRLFENSEDSNLKEILNEIEKNITKSKKNDEIEEIKLQVINKLKDDKKYTFQYGGHGKPLGKYQMTWLELGTLAYQSHFENGIENWDDKTWKIINNYFKMKEEK